MSGGGRGDNRGNRRRPFRHHEREKLEPATPESGGKKPDITRGEELKNNRARSAVERPRWVSPKQPTEPLPSPDCPYCGKPIKDISLAVADKNSGEAVHFDCVISRLGQGETLEPGDTISYIGGGRFGIVHFGAAPNAQGFTIKKIFEWENKENRAGWRQTVAEHFSVT